MKKIITTLLFCLAVFIMSPISYAADWQWISSTDVMTVSFDKDSIRKSERNKYFVWIKFEFTESEGIKQSNNLKLAKPISYQLIRFEFDYKNESNRLQTLVVYGKDGTSLANYTDKYSVEQFEPIIPGSTGEEIFYVTFAEYQNKYGKV
jgi:hypothetical protein